ncbi:MAG: acyl-CoA dehydrogenase family protein [Nitrososphaerales archaeon]
MLPLTFDSTEEQELIRAQVRGLCVRYPSNYWREVDKKKAYPEAFVKELISTGLLAALIPRQYGGSELGITDASIILEEINRSGGNSAACHAQMYVMSILLKHGSPGQKERYLPRIASGELRLQAFAVTEPEAGIDTTRIQTFAKKEGSKYMINGRKVFISRVQHSELMLLLARTAKYVESRKTDGLSIFLVDLEKAGSSIRVNPIETMINHETNELSIENLEVPEENLIGEEGQGFRYVLDGLNAERILISAECIGDAAFCLERAVDYAKTRIVFDRPIGKNQGVQFPLAQVYARLAAADLMRYRAAFLFDHDRSCGREANMAKLLASEVSLEAANVSMTTLGGYGMTVVADVERKLRESRLFIVAPIPNYMILSYIAEHVLSLPKSY